MLVTLVGLGCGTADTMTLEGRKALRQADCVVGAARLLEALPADCTAARRQAVRPEEIADILAACGAERPCVVYSGDTGFYSGARRLLPLLEARDIQPRVLPGISSVQLLAARLGRPWQDWVPHSAHGADCDPVAAVMAGKPAFFLTGGELTPAALCRRLTAAGLGELSVTVGEALSYPWERILKGTAAAFSEIEFAPLSVLLAEPAPRPVLARTPGFPDEAFLRDKIPMTRQEVRAAVLGKLALRPTDIVWDIGAGTGSVSVELAMAARQGRVFAVECQPKACGLIRRNRERFGTWNLHLTEGRAPEVLADLPTPDAVFIGGSRGSLEPILDVIFERNPAARVCVSAIALETLGTAAAALAARGMEAEVTQISVSRAKAAGGLHLLMANNPVFLVTAKSGEGAEG